MDSSLIGFAVIIGSILLARNVNGRAMALLTQEQQIQFQQSFQQRRWINLVVIIAQVVGYFLALSFTDWSPMTIMTFFFSSILLWIGIQSHMTYNALHKIDMPSKVIQMYLFSSVIRIVGIVAYVALMIER